MSKFDDFMIGVRTGVLGALAFVASLFVFPLFLWLMLFVERCMDWVVRYWDGVVF